MRLSEKRHSIGVALLLCLAGWLLYSNARGAGFQYDDYKIIVENPVMRHLSDFRMMWEFDPSRFLVNLTFAINFAQSKLNVSAYHTVNTILHILCAVLVFFFIRILLEIPHEKSQRSISDKRFIASFAAFLFLAHPLQTEAVTYIVQRSTVMVGIFYIGAILFYVLSRTKSRDGFYWFSLLLAFAGSMAKPIIVTLPFMLLCIEWIFFGMNKEDFRERIEKIAPFFAVIVLVMIFLMLWRFKAINWIRFIDITLETDRISRLTYFFTQFNVIVYYIYLLFVPFRQNLDYDFALSKGLFTFPTLVSFLLIIAIIVIAIKIIKKQRLLAFGILWFFITLIPESSVFTLSDVIFEHRLYLPIVGFSLFFSVWLCSNIRRSVLRVLIASAIICSFSLITVKRNALWANPERLLVDIIAKSPNKARPLNNLGDYYLRHGRLKKAERLLKRAIAAAPNNPRYYFNLGAIYEGEGRLKDAKAMYKKAIDMNPSSAKAKYYFNLANILRKEGDLTRAELYYRMSLIVNPGYTPAFTNLGNLYSREKRFKEAVDIYKESIKRDPYALNSMNGLASVYTMVKNYDMAIEEFRKLLSIAPDLSIAYNNLGNVYVLKKDLPAAELIFKDALRAHPNDVQAHINLANVYFGMKRNKEAMAHIKKAVSIMEKHGNIRSANALRKRYFKKDGT